MLDQIYNGWIPGTELDSDRRNYSLSDYQYLAEQVQFIIDHFGLAPSDLNVLDFGFGWGHWARMAMAYGSNVSGVELSNERMQHGESVGIKILALADLPAQKFHFINTEQVFEHLTEPRLVLDKLVQALSVDGVIKISVPDSKESLKKLNHLKDFGALTSEHQMALAPMEHVNSYTHDSLVQLGRSVGLKKICPSFYKLFNSASGLLEVQKFLRVAIRPFYRHIYPRSTFIYFVRA